MFEKKINVNGVKTNYKLAGSGPAVLILHGWGSSSDSWLRVEKILSDKGYKVIVPDFPGFGKSNEPSSAWGVGDYSEWLKSFIDKVIGEQIFLLGHSFGGRIAIKFSAKYPMLLKGLILCSSAGITPRPKIKITAFSFFSKIGNLIFSILIFKPFRNLARKIAYFFAGTRDHQFIQSEVMRETFKKVIAEDLLPELSDIKTKTLIIWGKKDKMVPVKYAYIFHQEIKNSELKILTSAGHSPHLEMPEKLSEIIINFFQQ